MRKYILLVSIGCMLTNPASATPWADAVISYDPGTNASSAFRDPTTSLGAPARTTGGNSDVTMFNPPFGTDQIVAVGSGGHLRVFFDEPVVDDPGNPYGIDLLIFGNALFFGDSAGSVTGIFAEPASIHLSQDGTTFHPVSGVFADALFPTQGFQDTTDPFGGFGVGGDGTISTDFTRPVNPALTLDDLAGRAYAEVLELYAGSGGGTGVDLASVGLGWIQYVEVRGIGSAAEIDAFADVSAVPEAGSTALSGMMLALIALRRRRQLE